MKILIIFISLALLGAVVYWFMGPLAKELPGEIAEDNGRDHVTDIFGVDYSSTPPSSGPHFPIWAKKGFYDRLISDGYLIHSLEHGYIVISYDCDKAKEPFAFLPFDLLTVASAHDEPGVDSADSGEKLMHLKLVPSAEMSAFTPQTPPEVEIELPEGFKSEECKSLEDELKNLVNFRERVIVVPRLNMDKPIAATSWGRVMKLDSFDRSKLEDFIASYHNKGPEKTVE